MIVKNATTQDLEQALKIVNKKYKENVIWQRAPETIGRRLRFTLRVKDSNAPAARVGAMNGHRMISACWHAHGDLFDALFSIAPDAEVSAGGSKITAAAGNWKDRNIGSIIYPMYYSDACKCE